MIHRRLREREREKERELFHRIDGKTTATSHCFETFVSMVIYPTTEQPIIFRDMPTPWGSAPRRVIVRLRAARLPRFPFFQREKKRLDPFNALLSGQTFMGPIFDRFTGSGSRRENGFPNRCRRLHFLSSKRKMETVGKFVARRNFVPPFLLTREIQPGRILTRHRRGHLDIRRRRLFSLMTR